MKKTAAKKAVAGLVYMLLLHRSVAQTQEPQPVNDEPGNWSVSLHVLTGEMPGTQGLAGIAWRKGRHKFEASIMAGPFGKSYSPRIQPPVLTYRCFMFNRWKNVHPYLMAMGAASYSKRVMEYMALIPGVYDDPNAGWQTKAIQTEKFTNVCITFGAGAEFQLNKTFYIDAHLSLGPCYYRYRDTQVYENSTFRPPVPYRNTEGTRLGAQVAAGLGYRF